jgi:hypothetical protein
MSIACVPRCSPRDRACSVGVRLVERDRGTSFTRPSHNPDGGAGIAGRPYVGSRPAMSRKRRMILAAALGVLGAMSAVLGLHLNGRDTERSFVDDLVVVPLVLGKDEREATEAVERVGLRPEITYTRFRAKHPSLGQVVMQSLGNSRIASRGDSVRLVVADAKRQPRPDYSPFAHWPGYWPD